MLIRSFFFPPRAISGSSRRSTPTRNDRYRSPNSSSACNRSCSKRCWTRSSDPGLREGAFVLVFWQKSKQRSLMHRSWHLLRALGCLFPLHFLVLVQKFLIFLFVLAHCFSHTVLIKNLPSGSVAVATSWAGASGSSSEATILPACSSLPYAAPTPSSVMRVADAVIAARTKAEIQRMMLSSFILTTRS